MVEKLDKADITPIDHIGFTENDKTKALLQNETVVFAALIKKSNSMGMVQERTFVITLTGIYNIHKVAIKRKLEFANISSLSKTVHPSPNKTEFTVHVAGEYDYRFFCDNREDLIRQLKAAYFQFRKKNLPIFGITAKDLKDVTTSEADAKKSIFKHPGPEMRLFDEDIYTEDKRRKSIARKALSVNPSQLQEIQEELSKDRLYRRDEDSETKLTSFEIQRMLGKGSQGKVYLVKNSDDGKNYAMKIVPKTKIKYDIGIVDNYAQLVCEAVDEHPFVSSRMFVFNEASKFIFVQSFTPCGELYFHLKKVGKFSEHVAKFFIAQLILALGHLHKNLIVYKDLRAENIMVAQDGYLKLTDYNLSRLHTQAKYFKKSNHRLAYVAPEALAQQIDNSTATALDWWSLGILLYELLMGFPPFNSPNQHKLKSLINNTNVVFPDPKRHQEVAITEDCKDFINKLLTKDPQVRLGTKNGYNGVLSHNWFSDFDINDLQSKKSVSPYKVELDTEDQFQYFNKKYVDCEWTNPI